MKKFLILILLGAVSWLSACRGPFEGVTAILSNSYIDHRVSVQVVNANPKAIAYYPAEASITLSGDAVKQGLIYTAEGTKATEEAGFGPDSVAICLDVAASQFFDENKNGYIIENKILSSNDLVDLYSELTNNYPIFSIEDGMS